MDADKGQHFLVDGKILRKEVDAAELTSSDKVIEIGAGSGILTKELVKYCSVLSFEVDSGFKHALEQIESKNLKLVFSDALKYNWRGYSKIVSNIPYFLSEAIIMKAIESEINILVLIVGSRFKEKLEGEDKIGQIARLFYDIKVLDEVSKLSFEPSPRVNSWLVKLTLKKQNKMEKLLGNIVMFNGKIKNAVIYALVQQGKTKNQSREIIDKLGLDKNILEKSSAKITGALLQRLSKLVD